MTRSNCWMTKALFKKSTLRILSRWRLAFLLTTLASVFGWPQAHAGTWTKLAHTAPNGSGGLMLLLTDGTVMCKSSTGGASYGNAWNKLTPDIHGSYVNGTWTTLAPMADTRLYFASQVLKDGRVFVAGGEYGTGGSAGETYNPQTNTWTPAPVQSFRISDANSALLPDGRVLVALVTGNLKTTTIFDPGANTWTTGPTCNGIHNESVWVEQPDGSTLFVDRLTTNSERYIPALNQWLVDGTVPVSLYDPYGDETGPGFLLPNGKSFFIGSTSNTAYYTPSGTTSPGTWATGPTIPGAQGAPDAPGAMMPNGKILCALSPTPTSANHFPTPTIYYEFDYTNNTFTALPTPSGGTSDSISSFVANMLDLPDGSVMFNTQGATQYYVYNSGGTPLAAGKPTVTTISSNGDGSYHLVGTQLTGISQGAAYGDDWQMSTNYPIVRLTTGTNVYYCRTYNWSTVGVATGSTPVTTEFTLPASLPLGSYTLQVVANGIASDPVPFGLCTISPGAGIPGATVTITGVGFTGSTDVDFNGTSAVFTVNSDTQITATVPAGATTGYVTVVTPSGTVSTISMFAILAGDGAPTIASFTPASGLVTSSVTITGTNFAGISSVAFNGDAASFTVNSQTQITATVPTPTTGTTGFITVTNAYGTATSASPFTTLADLAVYNSATDVPITANGFTATGTQLYFTLNYAPTPGTNLTVVNNTGLTFISGAFSNLAQGQTVTLSYNGIIYNFVANYYGGTGNDLVLQWAAVRPVGWGLDNYSQLGNNNSSTLLVPVGVSNTGALAGKTVTVVAAGSSHTLALCSDGTVAAWGYNGYGQLGNGATANSAVPVTVSTAGTALAGKTVVAIAAGQYHSLALCSDGTVVSWGYGFEGELGNNGNSFSSLPVAVTTAGTALAGKTVTAVAAGSSHSLALCSDGTVAAWGLSTNGQLGNNSTTTRLTAVAVSTAGTALAGKTVTAVAGGGTHSLALCSDGTLCAWGLNSSGQLGNNSTTQSLVAVNVSTSTALAGKTVSKIAASLASHNLALCSDGTLVAWGFNTSGQLGIGSTTNSLVPVAVTTTGTALAGKTVTAVQTGQFHSLVLCSDGSVASWGSATFGQLGNNSTTVSTVAVNVSTVGTALAGKSVAALAGGGSHSVALCTDGTVTDWGYNFYGQLGNGAMNASVPVATITAGTPLAGKTIVAESAGTSHSLALCADGTVSAWGYNVNGQLGNNSTISTLTPVAVTTTGVLSGKTVIAVSAGANHSLALCSDGTVAAWGLNTNGQLGNNSTTQSTVPVLVTTAATALAGKTVIAISAGGNVVGSHSLALCSDGTVVAWGYNSNGQLGNNSTTQSTVAVAVNSAGPLSGKTVTAIAAGGLHSMALCSDGTLAAWGLGANGQLGNNGTGTSSVPVTVTTSGVLSGKTVNAIAAGYWHSMALCSDGTVAAWGGNNNGQLGNNSTIDVPVPVAVDTSGVLSGKAVTHISAGQYHSLAQCSDGSAVAWGYDGDGELGNNSSITSSMVPVAVSTASLASGESFEFEASGANASHSLALVASAPSPHILVQLASGTALSSGGSPVNFGNSAVGTGVTQSFTIINNGFAPMTISGVTIDGANAADFTVSTAPASSLAVGAITTMGVTFKPSAALSRNAAIHIASNDPATGSFTMNVTGSGNGALAVTYNSATDVPLTASGFTATGSTVSFILNYVPTTGTNLTVVRNTGPTFIQGAFTNLAQGQKVSLTRSGIIYTFVANYYGGSGKDLVLQWADTRPAAWGSNVYGQLGNNKSTQSLVAQPVVTAGTALAGKTVTSIFSGEYHHLAVCSDGSLASWGYNGFGQLGNNTIINNSAPVAVTTTGTPLAGKTVVSMAGGFGHSLAVCSDGTLAAWGYNVNGQLGNNSTTQSNVPVAVTTTGVLAGKTVIAVAAGYNHSLALCSNGTVAAWGLNGNGQLGNSSTTQSTVPVLVTTAGTALAGKTVVAITAGLYHSVALCSDGTVVTWGLNGNGQLGNNSTTQSTVPVAVTSTGALLGKTVTSVSAGWDHTSALCSDGTFVSWGYNAYGQLGTNSTTQSTVPVALTTAGTPLADRTIVSVSAGAYHELVLCSDGTMDAWGQAFDGQLGNNSITQSNDAVAVTIAGTALAGKTVAKFTAGADDNLVLNSDGSLVAWGYNTYGQLGDNIPSSDSVAVPVTITTPLNAETVTALAAGNGHTLALCADGTVAAWGENTNGQLGAGTGVGNSGTADSSVPVAVSISGGLQGKKVAAVAAGFGHSLALCTDGTVASWGYNGFGQLGNNSTTQSTTPVAVITTGVLTGKTVVAIATGSYHCLALCSDGTLASWGYNSNGQLGNNSTTQSNLPVAVVTAGTALAGKTVIAIGAATSHSVALCSDGTMAAWGYNAYGQLGNGNTTQNLLPVAVNTTGVLLGRTVIALRTGQYYNLVLCSDGTVAAWGQNANGQLGNNSTTNSSVPVLVNTAGVLSGKTVVSVAADGYAGMALCSDGTLASWGDNGNGELGNNSFTQSNVPVLVNTASLATGERFVLAASGQSAYHSLGLVAEPVFPVANTLAATAVTITTVTLNASVNPDGNTTTTNFQYGLTTSYGSSTSAHAAGSGGSFVAVNSALTGLTGHRTYHYRIAASSVAGAATGADMTFTTLDTPPVANADTANNVAGATTISVLANDTDADGDSLSITGVTQGALGAVTTDGNTVTYTPGANFTTSDTFTYTISDGFSGTATGNVTVHAAPEQTWRVNTFGANSNNPAISGDNADPNNNGIPNLMEYALHGDAEGGTTGVGILPQSSTNATTGALQLGFTRYADRNDITLIVQANDALTGTWTNLAQSVNGTPFTILTTGATISESGTGNAISVTVGDLYQTTDPSHPQRFMRLMVTRP